MRLPQSAWFEQTDAQRLCDIPESGSSHGELMDNVAITLHAVRALRGGDLLASRLQSELGHGLDASIAGPRIKNRETIRNRYPCGHGVVCAAYAVWAPLLLQTEEAVCGGHR